MTKKVLVLGAGLVSRPLVRYLLGKTDYEVICASRTVSKAEKLITGFDRGSACPLMASDDSALESLIKDVDLVISLLPYTYHVRVAEFCLKHKKNMVTTSYVSPDMKALDARAKEQGVLLLNEIGLDPGIDHMSAMRVIHHVKKNGGKVTSFRSCCGGLPAPEANTNPMGYKFSWSPRGVLMAGRNAAKFKLDGTVMDIPGPELFASCWPLEVPGGGSFEHYPNRDSMPYVGVYGLEGVQNMLRGTIRYKGWCSFWYRMASLGILSDVARDDLAGRAWGEVMRTLVPGNGDLKADLCKAWGVDESSDEFKRAEWIGLLGTEKVSEKQTNLLDALCTLLQEKLPYEDAERDMIVLFHEFIAEYADGQEHITSTLIDYGIPNGDSAMSRTVSLPASIAARLILEDGFEGLTGVHIPVLPEIYKPVLRELESMGITCTEVFSPRQ